PEYERNSPRMSSNSYVNLKIATCLVRYADDRLIDQRFPSGHSDRRRKRLFRAALMWPLSVRPMSPDRLDQTRDLFHAWNRSAQPATHARARPGRAHPHDR
ncbi:hypothetical protein, partial [Burkholderia stabilis]|uniref:hypothetical protein n=1 Tax=Burkholderia stabilis TaxID=95485 RepID=UPI001ABA47B1